MVAENITTVPNPNSWSENYNLLALDHVSQNIHAYIQLSEQKFLSLLAQGSLTEPTLIIPGTQRLMCMISL